MPRAVLALAETTLTRSAERVSLSHWFQGRFGPKLTKLALDLPTRAKSTKQIDETDCVWFRGQGGLLIECSWRVSWLLRLSSWLSLAVVGHLTAPS